MLIFLGAATTIVIVIEQLRFWKWEGNIVYLRRGEWRKLACVGSRVVSSSRYRKDEIFNIWRIFIIIWIWAIWVIIYYIRYCICYVFVYVCMWIVNMRTKCTHICMLAYVLVVGIEISGKWICECPEGCMYVYSSRLRLRLVYYGNFDRQTSDKGMYAYLHYV
jgi:hypothetical protein